MAFCSNYNKYEKLAKIGQGTYGEVFMAKNRETKEVVAMKKLHLENEKEGFSIANLPEIKILRHLDSKNVVKLIEVCYSKHTPYTRDRKKSTVFLIFEFCEHDLAGLLRHTAVQFTVGDIKSIMKQILEGLHFIHCHKIFHRDVKPANILLTNDGVLKLADFGMARAFSDSKENRYTNLVVTLWYRPPELLLGERSYTTAIDMWGAGCIFAELWTRNPIVQGNMEQHQLQLICQLCGSITPEVWPDVVQLVLYRSLELPKNCKRRVKDRLQEYVNNPQALDLLDKLLILDPAKRYDSATALNHDFFHSDPQPSDLKNLLSKFHFPMFEHFAPPRGNVALPGPSALPRTTENPHQ